MIYFIPGWIKSSNFIQKVMAPSGNVFTEAVLRAGDRIHTPADGFTVEVGKSNAVKKNANILFYSYFIYS